MASRKRIEQQAWDQSAPIYGGLQERWTGISARKLVQMAHVREGESVLDVATGSGIVVIECAAQARQPTFIVGVDFSKSMIASAISRANLLGVRNVGFCVSDAEELGFGNDTFDVVLVNASLMLFENSDRALSEIARVAKKGGRMAFSVLGRKEHVGFSGVMELWLRYANIDVEKLHSMFRFSEEEFAAKSLRKAGLVLLEMKRLRHNWRVSSLGEAWDTLLSGGTAALAYYSLPQTAQEEVKRESLLLLEEFHTPRGVEMPVEVCYILAKKTGCA